MSDHSARKQFREYCKQQDELHRKDIQKFANGYTLVILGLPILIVIVSWLL